MEEFILLNPANWVKKYGDYLYSIAYYKTSNKLLAEDLVQDTFLAALKAKDSFKGNSSEKTWLTAILKNKIIDYYRKQDALKNTSEYLHETEQSFNEHFFSSDGHWNTASTPKEFPNSDNQLLSSELQEVIVLCLSKIPPKLKPAFLMKYIDDEESDTICKTLNITQSNYWVLLHRVKLLMRSCLEKNG